MLILKRKVGKSIHIGDDIRVLVLKVDPDQTVELGIDAPRETKILRSELLYRKRRQEKNNENSEDSQAP